MNRSRILLAAGVALALIAFVGVLAFGSQGNNNTATEPHTVTVVVAAQDVGLGTALTAAMLTTEERAADQAVATYGTVDELVGVVARRAIVHGQVVHTSDFQTGSDGTSMNITQSLGGGKRAIAVSLDKASAVAYLVQPGDWVDVMIALEDKDDTNPVVATNPRAYQTTTSPDGSSSTDTTPYIVLDPYLNNTSVKVIVQNVQVLAVEQDTAQAQNNVSAPQAVKAPEFIAVLAVTPQQAEMLRFAQLDGNVSLVLRSPADQSGADVATSGITLHELVEKWGVLPPVPVLPGQ